jgi:DNA-binding XRE family transcriptional regulator
LNFRLKERGMTQQELADLLDITQPAVSQFATGKYVLSLELAANIARILRCTIENLYIWIDE